MIKIKRTGVVWSYTVFVVILILSIIAESINIFFNPYGMLGVPPMAYYAQMILIILIIPQMVFITLFFMLKKKSLTWLYISFGLGIVVDLVTQQWGWAILMAIFGWAMRDYILNKKVDGQPLFT